MFKINKKDRKEKKYIISNEQLAEYKNIISNLLELDSHSTIDGKYTVHTLYFDDYTNTSLDSTTMGLNKKSKWRIRYYENDFNYIVLEKKEKTNDNCYKKLVTLTIDEYNKIISRDISELIYDTNKLLVKELIADMLMYNYIPKVIIDYDRTAYVDEVSNIRITFDSNISVSKEIHSFLEGDYQKYYLLPNYLNILEIKYDYILPSHLSKAFQNLNYYKMSFSKYRYGRMLINNYLL